MKFRLTNPHYLRIDNKQHYFEQKETPSGSTEAVTHRMRVDTYLDPNDPTQWNWDLENNKYRKPGSFRIASGEQGGLVLTDKAEGHPYELVYSGPLTTEMEGLDEAARKKIQAIQVGLLHPIESLPAIGPTGGNVGKFNS